MKLASLIFLTAFACGCGGGGKGRANDPAAGSGGSGGSSGSNGSGGTGNSGGGVRIPDVTIGDDRDTGLDVRDNTLAIGTGPAGPLLLWLFTVENTTSAPLCGDSVPARLYDSGGALLAGSPASGGPFIDATTPGLSATVMGKPYRAEGGPLLDCVPPGERGIGRGSVIFQVEPFGPDEMQRIIDRTTRIEFSYAGLASSGTEGIELATDLLWLDELELTEASGGKVLRGSVKAGADITRWQVDGALFDAAGQITDVVSAYGTPLSTGGSAEFELPAGSETATRFEALVEGAIAVGR
jgi:hypothetical protein